MQKPRFTIDFRIQNLFAVDIIIYVSTFLIFLFIHAKTMNMEIFNQVYDYLFIFLYTCIFGAIMKWAHNFMHGKDFATYIQIVMVGCSI